MNSFLLHGTQQRFVDEIKKNGLTHKNSSVFIVDSDNKGDLEFTIKMALYHAIGIQTQNEILNGGYSKISDFYRENPELLPVLIFFNKKIDFILDNQRYKSVQDEKILTFPYDKISNIGNITRDKIIKIISITLEDIEQAEKQVKEKLGFGRDRFFVKSSEDVSENYVKDKNLINCGLISKCYLYIFLGYVASIKLEN